MICQVTFLSGGLKVKGYMGVPGGIKLPVAEIGRYVSDFYGSGDLPVTEIADSLGGRTNVSPPDKLPVLLYCRGGLGKVGRVKTHWIEQFAEFGYLVFAPCYRGSEGGEGRDEFGGAENEDVMSALRFLRSLPFVDPHKITLMGFSRGSINAAQTAAEMPGAVRKLILWSGISDLAQTYEERVDLRRMLKRVIGGTPAKVPDAYRRRSPLHLAERLSSPVLLMHGTDDPQVAFEHSLNMHERLQHLGAAVEMHRYEGCTHLFPPDVHRQALERMFAWIEAD